MPHTTNKMAENQVLLDLIKSFELNLISCKEDVLRKRTQIEEIKLNCEQLQHKYVPALKLVKTPCDAANIKIATWNIQTFSEKNRSGKKDGICKQILGFDFVGMVDAKDNYAPPFPGYGQIAKRDGAIMFVYHDKYEGYIQEISYDDLDVLLIKVDRDFTTVDNSRPFGIDKHLFIFVVYWRPYMKKNIVMEKVEALSKKIREINKGEKVNTILMGDFNAHTKETMEFDSAGLEPRLNCDVKKNARGSALLALCRDARHIILNGRCVGDLMGHYTYKQYQGSQNQSTIDYVITDEDLYRKVQYLYVHENKRELSDHCLVEVCLQFSNVADGEPVSNQH